MDTRNQLVGEMCLRVAEILKGQGIDREPANLLEAISTYYAENEGDLKRLAGNNGTDDTMIKMQAHNIAEVYKRSMNR